MRKAGIAQRLHHRRRQPRLFADEKGDDHRTRRPRHHRPHPRGDGRPQTADGVGHTRSGVVGGRRQPFGLADDVAGGAKPEKVTVALEIEGAGCGRRRQRAQHGGEFHPVTRLPGGLPAAQPHADAARRGGGRQRPDADGVESEPGTGRERLDVDDTPADGDRPDAMAEDRCGDGVHPHLGGGETPGDAERRNSGDQHPARMRICPAAGGDETDAGGQRHHGGARPQGRFDQHGEVAGDAEADQHRCPQEPALALGKRLGGYTAGPGEERPRGSRHIEHARVGPNRCEPPSSSADPHAFLSSVDGQRCPAMAPFGADYPVGRKLRISSKPIDRRNAGPFNAGSYLTRA